MRIQYFKIKVTQGYNSIIRIINSQWRHATLVFIVTFLVVCILLPWIRKHPESVHAYFNGLKDWLREGFLFFLCTVFMAAIFKLLSPRPAHLRHAIKHPPGWLAVLLGVSIAAIIDIICGFDVAGYRGTLWEWLKYGGGSLLIVWAYKGLPSEVTQVHQIHKLSSSESSNSILLQYKEDVPWEDIEKWLNSDEPAECDLLGNRSVATRLSGLIREGTRSLGIVGPFGAGKTSIVHWMKNDLKKSKDDSPRYLVCHHSCWEFETSATAIHELLRSAISELSALVDTFQIDSLPEAYRRTFSAGGNWVESFVRIILPNPNPIDQFSRLSDLLASINYQLIFIIEDLDRYDTKSFEVQEVLAFLERLKRHLSFSFVLTGDHSTTHHVSYPRLCEHLELLTPISTDKSTHIIKLLFDKCLSSNDFRHVEVDNPINDLSWNILKQAISRVYGEPTLLQAIAALSNTPRSLRLALGRTYSSWKALHGEIYLNHLLVLNVLRFGAPECFLFLIRRWSQFSISSPFSKDISERIEKARTIISEDWNNTIKNVEWDPNAAIHAMNYLFPSTSYWLLDKSAPSGHNKVLQSVSFARYWFLAINEVFSSEDIRDQVVISDIHAWLENPNYDSNLVRGLTSSDHYAEACNHLIDHFLNSQSSKSFLLCEHVFQRILTQNGSLATHSSQGFQQFWFIVSRNTNSITPSFLSNWTEDRVSDAAKLSLEMVNSLWHLSGGLIKSKWELPDRLKERQSLRLHLLNEIRTNVTNGQALIDRLSPKHSTTLYYMIFDPGNNQDNILNDAQSWAWLGPPILESIKSGNIPALENCGVLITTRFLNKSPYVDIEVLEVLFGPNKVEVIDILELKVNQLSMTHQQTIKEAIKAARKHFEAQSNNQDPLDDSVQS